MLAYFVRTMCEWREEMERHYEIGNEKVKTKR